METEKADGVYYADGEAAASPTTEKQGHLFFGCCCDTRRATIIVNVINMVMAALALFGMGVVASSGFADQFDDDAVKADLATAQQYIWIPILISAFSILCAGLGMYGAMKYKQWMVMVGAVWYCINSVLSILGGDLGGAALSGLFAYPHFVFMQEMKKGIMTEANYPNEKHSCCCV
mmetsp:Transcript_101600/g.152245  ORF Transcript_101600/g.152245 Transcript_101600/m.152245 type:complete len:176 (-) Transcript_101600:239-766(-)|eukprot:CAMPEP_0117031396 /NCGR_PEP_ID=MMETSP0472-20121206/22572_1 /TAXON_ID=693140 ORGANISM="Tiarina fusus, Strain LIS" /NCGR_SAMPLE_ID=MMETSP0472 /ASSEMBLY_ACC=CAM_ASM_000603 /LENGTH=175 /DNA_ID=CAMNT_0004739715 /DNA_START=94 /DNA_END=621 /DNA_ORIENTATION=+